MNQIKSDNGIELNMTPMIDIVFLLLIFFMVVSELAQLDDADVELPIASKASIDGCEPDPSLIILSVQNGKGANEKILAQGRELDERALMQYIHQEAIFAGTDDPETGSSNLRVKIRADRNVITKAVQMIFDACAKCRVFKTEIVANPGPSGEGTTVLSN